MRRVLLLIPSTSYRASDFLAAAARLDVRVVVGSDHTQVLSHFSEEHTLGVNLACLDKGLEQISDPEILKKIIKSVLQTHTTMVEEYRSGQKSRMGFFVGQTMKATGGKANPKMVNELLNELLR